jgi:hypothetical protein
MPRTQSLGDGDEGAYESVTSIYIWSKNFNHSVNEKSEAKMAAIDVQ